MTNNKKPKIQRYDYRHRACNRLLFRGYLAPGSVLQIRCPKCGGMVTYKPDLDNPAIMAILLDSEGV